MQTDAEVVAGFMEPGKPSSNLPLGSRHPASCLWSWEVSDEPVDILDGIRTIYFANSLDALHLVEARLTDEQWQRYKSMTVINGNLGEIYWKRLLHASAADKLKALAVVLAGKRESK